MYFSFPCKLTEEPTHFEFPSPSSAASSPLPKALFETFPVLDSVFISGHMLTLNVKLNTNWEELIPDIQKFLLDYFHTEASLALVSVGDQPKTSPMLNKEGQTISKTIESTLEEYIQPALARDGGSVSFISYKDGHVQLQLKGACRGCPSSTYTLKAGIERLLMNMIPEVQTVEAIDAKDE